MAVTKPTQTTGPLITGLPKLIALTLLTGGLYELYWFYKNWRGALPPKASSWQVGLYAVFAGFSCFGLFKRLKIPYWPTVATAYLVLPAAFSLLPSPYRYLSYLLALAPILYVQIKVNATHPQVAPTSRLRLIEWIMLLIGLPLTILSVVLQQQA